jgi:hypothetical protein
MQVVDSEGYLKVKLVGGPVGPFVPYTGATGNVDLGTHSLTARNIIVNHPSGSGVAVSITKGGAGEALTVVKTSGSGNAMSVAGGNVQFSTGFFWDSTNGNLGIGTSSPSSYANLRTLTINGTNGSVIDFKTSETLYGEIYSLVNELRIDALTTNGVLKFLTNSVEKMRIASTGNVLINTTTDAGFKFDVNGTARVQGKLTVSTGGIDLTGTLTNFSGYQGYGQMQLFSGSAFQMFNAANNSKASFQYTTATGLSLSINPENLSGILNGLAIGPSLVASANNQTLVGLDINPTYTLGAFTDTARIGARIQNSRFLLTGTYNSLGQEFINPDSLMQINSTIVGRGGSRAIAFRINPTINVNGVLNQVFAALEVTPTYQNVGAGSSALAINSSGPNVFGTVNVFGAQTTFLGQGGTSTFHYVGTIPNGQGFRVQVNSNIAGYSFEFNGSGIPTFTLRNNNINAIQVYSTGNTGVNTSVDSGFKLDVNGTARVVNQLTVQGMTIGLGGGAVVSNTVVGNVAFNSNTSGQNNTAIGESALFSNTTGTANVAVGRRALFASNSAQNVALGNDSLRFNTAANNTAVGYFSLYNNTTGASNTSIGHNSGNTTTTGSGNVFIGKDAVALNATDSNQFVVGSSTTNAGSVTTEINTSTQVWNVVINGVARKILLA